MAVKGPRLESEITLDWRKADKEMLRYKARMVGHARNIAKGTKEQIAAERKQAAITRANIAHTNERIKQFREEMRARSRVTAAIKRQTAATKQATHSFGTFSKALGTSITLWYTARTAVFAFTNSLQKVIDVYKKGVTAIDDFRSTVISVSAIMAPHVQEGTTAFEKFSVAIGYNEEMLLRLEKAAAKHISTGKSLIQVYEGIVIAGVFPDEKDVENVAQLADFITLYTKGQRLEIQLMQEVRGLMDGQVRAQNKLAYTLDRMLHGNLKVMLKTWKEMGRDQDGSLVILNKTNELLGDIRSAQSHVLSLTSTWVNTWDVVEKRLLRRGVQGAYEEIRSVLEDIVKYFFDMETGELAAPGQTAVQILRDGWRAIRDMIVGAIGEVKLFGDNLHDTMQNFREFLRDADAVKFGQDLRRMFNAAVEGLKGFGEALKILLIVRGPLWLMKFGKIFTNSIIATIEAGAVGAMALAAGFFYVASRFEVAANIAETTGKEIRELNNVMAEATNPSYVEAWNGIKDSIRLVGEVADGAAEGVKKFLDKQIWARLMALHTAIQEWRAGGEPLESYKKALAVFQAEVEKISIHVQNNIESIGNQLRVLREYGMGEVVKPSFPEDEGIEDPKKREERLKAWYRIGDRTITDFFNRKKQLQNYIDRVESDSINAKVAELEAFSGLTSFDEDIKRIEEVDKLTASYAKKNKSLYEQLGSDRIGAMRDNLAEENKMMQEKYKGDKELLDEWNRYHGLKSKEINRMERDRWATTAQIAISSTAEAFRMMAEHNKKWFKWYQMFAIGEIAINAAIAIMRGYAELGPIGGTIAAAFLGGLAAVQSAAVLAQEPPEELALGGVSETGFGAAYGVYGKPTYMFAEKAGKPEAVVPLDKYDISSKGEGEDIGGIGTIVIQALDSRSFAEFAKRNPGAFRQQIIAAIRDNDPSVRGALKTAVR